MQPTPTSTSRAPAVLWLLWALAAAASIQLAPNPIYVTLVIAIAVFLTQAHAVDGPVARTFPVLVAIAVLFAIVRVVLTAATTHGTGDVLFTVPDLTLPQLLGGFTVGGTVEAPVVARAAAEGWAIVGIIAVFAAFNSVVSHHELVQAAPRAFYEIGLAVTVAIAFVPSTITAIATVREADRARTGGHVVRRGRLMRQVVPVLETGLERAVGLAESMDSRGFARATTTTESAAGVLGLGSMLCLGGAFVAMVARANVTALAMGLTGAVLLVGAVVTASRGASRVMYRPRQMSAAERGLAAAAWIAPIGLVLVTGAAERSLRWPGDVLTAPSASLVALLAIGALAVAPLVTSSQR